MTDRNGTQTHITYNMYHSITGRRAVTADQSSTVTESYGYYPDGSLRYAIGGGMRYDYSYDVMGRLVKKSASGRSLLVTVEKKFSNRRIAGLYCVCRKFKRIYLGDWDGMYLVGNSVEEYLNNMFKRGYEPTKISLKR